MAFWYVRNQFVAAPFFSVKEWQALSLMFKTAHENASNLHAEKWSQRLQRRNLKLLHLQEDIKNYWCY